MQYVKPISIMGGPWWASQKNIINFWYIALPFFALSHFGSSRIPFLEMAPADAIAAIVGDWKRNEKLTKQAASAIMAVVGKQNEITRQEVVANHEVLIPVVKHFGFLSGLAVQFVV